MAILTFCLPSAPPYASDRLYRKKLFVVRSDAAESSRPKHDPVVQVIPSSNDLGRSMFPKNFVFGAGSSGFQAEGATEKDGRKDSIWDEWAKTSGKIAGGFNLPFHACGQYDHYKEHVRIIKNMGLDSYRFSISWPRLLDPDTGRVNNAGLAYYNKFISELLKNGIEPCVTLFHWELPLAFQKAHNGWLNKDGMIVEKFVEYADLCFSSFGDRVKIWATLNEPYVFTTCGYAMGVFPPGKNDDIGAQATEPYIVGHNLLLAHSAAVNLYRTKFKKDQKGEIGITLDSMWYEPTFDASSDAYAARRAIDFHIGWFLDPIVHGKYPDSMEERVGDRLPEFTNKEAKMLRGSYDFIGLNYYTAKHVTEYLDDSPPLVAPLDGPYYEDRKVILPDMNQGLYVGPFPPDYRSGKMPDLLAFQSVPWGLFKVLSHIHTNYKQPPIYVHENGTWTKDVTPDTPDTINDWWRIRFLASHLYNVHAALSTGVDVRGYYHWALFNNWEFISGWTKNLGLYMVKSTDTSFEAWEKKSGEWYRNFLSK